MANNAQHKGSRVASGRVLRTETSYITIADAFVTSTFAINEQISLQIASRELQPGALVRLVLDEHEIAIDALVAHSGGDYVFAPGSDTERFLQRGVAQHLRARQMIVQRVRQCFAEQDFLEVETPILVGSPGLDLHLSALRTIDDRDASQGFLQTSPEYHMKRLVAGGVSRCFQFARCFRSDEHGSRHQLEFTMLEWYRAWSGWTALLADTERVVRAAFGLHRVQPIFTEASFEALTVREAFARWAPELGDPITLAQDNEREYFRALSEHIEPNLGLNQPQFLTHFAARHASLARLDDSDPTVCLRAELYYRGIELSNGFVELTDPSEQRARLQRDVRERQAAGLAVYPIDEQFLRALQDGLPPTTGIALGFDRLVAVVLQRADIADVIAFAR
jgi:lysyl-tRNA synthetase class 2